MANDRRRRLAALEAVRGHSIHEGATRAARDLLDRYGERYPELCARIRDAGTSEIKAVAIVDLLEVVDRPDHDQFWRTAKAEVPHAN